MAIHLCPMIGHLRKLEKLKRSMFHTRRMIWQSITCFEEVFSCESGPGHDTQFQAASAAIFQENNREQDHFIHYKSIPKHGSWRKRSLCIYWTSHTVCSKFCPFKTKQKTPHFDAPKAYQYALPKELKKVWLCPENGPEICTACSLEEVQWA